MTFSPAEEDFLRNGPRLARLATIGVGGSPHNVPVGYALNRGTGTIDVGGRDLTRTKKYRNAQRNPHVCIVIDDVLPPWRPRCVMVQGRAETLSSVAGPVTAPLIRIWPLKIVSWGLRS